MLTPTTWGLILLPIAVILNCLIPWVKNVRLAKAIGIPYVIVPVFAYNHLNSILLSRTISKLCDALLPPASNTSWRRLTGTAWSFKLKHAPFAELQTDTFLTVAPGGIILYTADADVIAQISSRGNEFPKATHLYRHVDIYGKNVVSSEGAIWRRHRAITASAFTEQNHRLVWKETLEITQSMLESTWVKSQADTNTVRTVANDAMKLSLGVIGRAGLGKRMEWPQATQEGQKPESVPPGHHLTFTEALQFVLTHIFYLIAMPMWMLRNSPVKKWQQCYAAYVEWGKYLEEMIASKRATQDNESAPLSSTSSSSDIDLISQLIKAQKLSDQSKTDNDQFIPFNDSDVIGNLFMFIIAGHETSANSIHFCILLLAMHPHIQRQVQDDLAAIFQEKPISAWSYDTDLKHLLTASVLAAVLNEQLRILGPVVAIPKITNHTPQQLTINDRECTLPPHTNIRICVASVHSNPKYWPVPPHPSSVATDSEQFDNHSLDFKPERWLLPDLTSASNSSTKKMHTPPKGAYLPFSDGPRACLGKRFAQIEILTALAVVFSQYSVELAVDEWADDEAIEGMDESERLKVWEKTRGKAERLLRDKVSTVLTLQLRGACVPVRFVKRGEERFKGL